MPDFSSMDSEALVVHLNTKTGDQPALRADRNGPVNQLFAIDTQDLPPLTAHIVREIYYSKGKIIDFSVADWVKIESALKHLIAHDPSLPTAVGMAKEKVAAAALAKNSAPPRFPPLPPSVIDEGRPPSTGDLARIGGGLDPVLLSGMDRSHSLNPDTPGSMRSWHQNDKLALPVIACDPAALSGKALMFHTYVDHFKGLQNKQKGKGVAQTYTGYIEYTCGGWREGITKGRIVYDYVNGRFYFTPDHYQTWYVVRMVA